VRMPRPSATAIRAAGGWANVRKDLPISRKPSPLKAGERPGHPVAGWMAEHQQSFGMVGCRGQETLVVGVAADDAVQHDDVVRLDFLRRDRNVDLAAGHPVAHPGCLREVGRVGVVGVDEFKVGGPARALAEQLELDVTDAASNLENAGAVDSSVDKIVDHSDGGLVEAAFVISGGEVSSEPWAEHVVASARVAAAHVSSICVGRAAVQPGRRHCGVMWTPDSYRWFPLDHRTSRRPGSGGQRVWYQDCERRGGRAGGACWRRPTRGRNVDHGWAAATARRRITTSRSAGREWVIGGDEITRGRPYDRALCDYLIQTR
jgi:hypothetical protein